MPLFAGVRDIVRANRSGGMLSNVEHFAPRVRADARVDADLVSLLYDPQTSGGLLIAAAHESADQVSRALEAAGVRAVRIGRVAAHANGVLVEIVV